LSQNGSASEALSLGQAVAGLTAVHKARSLGIIKRHEETPQKTREKERGEEFWIEVCGRRLYDVKTGRPRLTVKKRCTDKQQRLVIR
jgi:hypothetical protein